MLGGNLAVIEIISMLTYALSLDLTVCLCLWYRKMGIFLNVRQAPISLLFTAESLDLALILFYRLHGHI